MRCNINCRRQIVPDAPTESGSEKVLVERSGSGAAVGVAEKKELKKPSLAYKQVGSYSSENGWNISFMEEYYLA